jgi:hypothetical protein
VGNCNDFFGLTKKNLGHPDSSLGNPKKSLEFSTPIWKQLYTTYIYKKKEQIQMMKLFLQIGLRSNYVQSGFRRGEPFTYFGPGPGGGGGHRSLYYSSGGSSSSSGGSDGGGLRLGGGRRRRERSLGNGGIGGGRDYFGGRSGGGGSGANYWTPQDYLSSPMFDCLQQQRKPWLNHSSALSSSTSAGAFSSPTIRLSSLGGGLALTKRNVQRRVQLRNCKVL